MSDNNLDRRLRMQAMKARYDVTERTIDRWQDAGILPAPMRVNGVRYWSLRELEQCERERMSSQAPRVGQFKSRGVQRSADETGDGAA
jgi:hypothetical protein